MSHTHDYSVEAAKAFARECLRPQPYAGMVGEFEEGPGQRRPIYKAWSGEQVILALGPAQRLFPAERKEN